MDEIKELLEDCRLEWEDKVMHTLIGDDYVFTKKELMRLIELVEEEQAKKCYGEVYDSYLPDERAFVCLESPRVSQQLTGG